MNYFSSGFNYLSKAFFSGSEDEDNAPPTSSRRETDADSKKVEQQLETDLSALANGASMDKPGENSIDPSTQVRHPVAQLLGSLSGERWGSWGDCIDTNSFDVRGLNYMRDHVKQPAGNGLVLLCCAVSHLCGCCWLSCCSYCCFSCMTAGPPIFRCVKVDCLTAPNLDRYDNICVSEHSFVTKWRQQEQDVTPVSQELFFL